MNNLISTYAFLESIHLYTSSVLLMSTSLFCIRGSLNFNLKIDSTSNKLDTDSILNTHPSLLCIKHNWLTLQCISWILLYCCIFENQFAIYQYVILVILYIVCLIWVRAHCHPICNLLTSLWTWPNAWLWLHPFLCFIFCNIDLSFNIYSAISNQIQFWLLPIPVCYIDFQCNTYWKVLNLHND